VGSRRTLLLLALLALPARAGDDALEAILAAADSPHWPERWQAVEQLAALHDSDQVFKVRGLLLRDARSRVREAVAWACFRRPDLGNATLLGIALRKDASAPVRRAAARALVHFPDRRAVAALVDALATETDRRTRLQIVETLRALTPAPCLLDAPAWRTWWNAHEADPRFAPADEPPRVGEYEGVPLETRTVAAIPGQGKPKPKKPPHILVLPQFGWTTALFGPYLMPLREHAAVTWVRLPTVQQLTGRSGYGTDLPTYPVDRLVRALEAFRASLKIDRFLVFADGASGWIAMRYAVTYPDHCAGLILVDTALDKQAYVEALQRGAAVGTPTERFVAQTLMGQSRAAFDERTLDRLHVIGLESGYYDPADLEIAWLYRSAREPQGFATVPEIQWSRHRKIDLPALFLYSAGSAFSGHRDAERIQRHFPNSLVAPLKEARGMPFVEENEKFFEVIAHFLTRYGLSE